MADRAVELTPRLHLALEAGRASGGRGQGLFLAAPARRGERVLTFGGPLLSRRRYQSFQDFEHCLQIGPEAFLGPSGGLDDYTNHSCEPTTRVEIEDRGPVVAALVARRDLASGEEVTFDYSTVQLEDHRFRIESCCCGASSCRGRITDFTLLSWPEKKRLYEAGLLVWYVAEAFRDECLRRGLTPPAPPRR